MTDIFNHLANGGAISYKQGGELKLGVSTLPPLPKDCTYGAYSLRRVPMLYSTGRIRA